MTTRILIVGDSHTHALKRALKFSRDTQNTSFEFEAYRYSKMKNGKEIGDLSSDMILERVSSLVEGDIVVSAIGGNQHQSLSLIRHPVPFDICMPGATEKPSVDVVVPYAQLWDLLESGMRGKDGKRLSQLKAAAACTVIHLTPPPPKEDEAHIMKRHETDFAKAGILEKGVSPAPLRLKMWQLQVDVLQRLTAELDVELLPPPPQALDASGFLAHDYYADDATHGNQAYGALVLEQIKAMISARVIP